MAQDASGLTGAAQRLAQRVENSITSIPTPTSKRSTSWHDSMVRDANKSFRQLEGKKPSSPRNTKQKRSKGRTKGR